MLAVFGSLRSFKRRQFKGHDRREHRADYHTAYNIAAACILEPAEKYYAQYHKAQKKTRGKKVKRAERLKPRFAEKIRAASRQYDRRKKQLGLFSAHLYHPC